MSSCHLSFPLPGRMVPTLRQVLENARKEACSRQTCEINTGMNVLARSRATGWQKGRVLKTVTKGTKNAQHRILVQSMKIDARKAFTCDSLKVLHQRTQPMNSTATRSFYFMLMSEGIILLLAVYLLLFFIWTLFFPTLPCWRWKGHVQNRVWE